MTPKNPGVVQFGEHLAGEQVRYRGWILIGAAGVMPLW
jgi:hypothetical protein